MSGESAPRATAGTEPLDRVFGDRATCNACAESVEDYRVVALFLHQTAAVRAYCGDCYPDAVDGNYHAGGDGMLMDYATFAARFGAPGPPPPPTTPVDRMLAILVRDPALRLLSPGSEAFARKRRRLPYPVRAVFVIAGATVEAQLTMTSEGRMSGLSGDAAACAKLRDLVGG